MERENIMTVERWNIPSAREKFFETFTDTLRFSPPDKAQLNDKQGIHKPEQDSRPSQE